LETNIVKNAFSGKGKKLIEKKPTEKPKTKIDVDELKKALRESLSKLSNDNEEKNK
jgi:hypothetical protein